mgnify:FL=1
MTPRGRTGAALACALILSSAALSCASRGVGSAAGGSEAARRPTPDRPYRVERFRIGWYDSAGKPETPSRLRAMGFDTVMPYASRVGPDRVAAFLEAAEAEGIGVHLDVPRAMALDKDGGPLEAYVKSFAGSPSILSWYLFDEPEWKLEATPRKMEAAYSRVKALDPVRPVSMVFILPGLSAPYRGSLDRIWIDWYPLSKGSPEFAAFRGGRYADRMKDFGRRADRYGLPLTLVPQGFGEDEDGEFQFLRRLPTPAETRYMFWASFLARPEELVYWVLYRTRDDWLRDSLLPVVREFRGRFPDALEYRPSGAFRFDGGRADSVLMGDGRGGLWLAVLSREGRERELRIEAPEGYAFPDSSGGMTREIRRRLESYGVLLLEISEIP